MSGASEGDAAIKLAIELLHMPSRVRFARGQPLPTGVLQLLQIAAGDERMVELVVRVLERPRQIVVNASAFFVEQILLDPESSHYRVLGAEHTATTAELRRNMALLLRGLHPDVEHAGRSVFAQRVTAAWDQLKTPERRAAYDRQLRLAPNAPSQRSLPKGRRRYRRVGLRKALAAMLGTAKR